MLQRSFEYIPQLTYIRIVWDIIKNIQIPGLYTRHIEPEGGGQKLLCLTSCPNDKCTPKFQTIIEGSQVLKISPWLYKFFSSCHGLLFVSSSNGSLT